jgi:Flp pilus assembly protein TadG
MMNLKRHFRNRRGQGALEPALVLLVFLATLIGIFDMAQILFVHQTFVARLRGAARYGALNPDNVAGIKNMVLFGQATAPGGLTTGTLGLTSAMVTVARTDTGTNEDRVVVSITNYPYRMFSPWIGRTFTGRTLSASNTVETP